MDNTYPEDFFLLQRQINGRVLDDYLMQAAIIANPHKETKDAEEFIDNLLKQRKRYRPEDEAPEETDFAAIQALKDSLSKESNLIKAK